ncbi:MAG: cytochrome P450 [Myxococcota bacterium]|nr:cytochrome P450 [Myxococcota bacterium]
MAEPQTLHPSETSPIPWSEIPRTSLRESLRHAPRIRQDMLGVVTERYQTHGPVVRQKQGPMSMVNLFGPDANRMLLLDRDEIFSAKRSWHMIMGRIFTNGLLLRDGEDHRYHRRLLREAFRTPALESYLQGMNELIAATVDEWAESRGEFLAFHRIKEMALEMACRTFLGLPPGQDRSKLNRSFEATVAASMSIVRLPIPGLEFNRGLQGRRYMIELFQGLVNERRGTDGTDIFTRMCNAVDEEGKQLSDQEIIDHMIFLMMAAHDTTTSTLTSMLYELAKHPEWQERIRSEMRGLDKPAIEYNDVLEVPDTILAIQETLRRYPPLSTIPRVATESFEWAGCEIPANTMVVIYPIHTHHMEEWWSEPFRFDPDRFGPGREEHKRHSHSYIPFGGGNHMCLGLRFAELQIKAVLFELTKKLRWSVPDGYTMPVQQAPISKPNDGLPLTLERI